MKPFLPTINGVGDSITLGTGSAPADATKNTGYRYPFWNNLGSAGIKTFFMGQQSNGHDAGVIPIYHDGVAGDTIAMMKTRVLVSAPLHCPEIVLLHAGTNDANIFSTPAAAILTLLDDLILTIWNYGQRPVAFNKTRLIVVAQICPLPNANDSIVVTLNGLIPAMAATHRTNGRNVQVVNMYGALGANPGPNYNGGSPPHPNANGYLIMAQTWAPPVISYIRNR